MSINDFIEYAKVLRKYKPILEEYNYYIDVEDDMLSLSNNYDCDMVFARKNYTTNYTPTELEEYIQKVLIRNKKDEIIQKMEKLQEEQKRLEIVLKTIDNIK